MNLSRLDWRAIMAIATVAMLFQQAFSYVCQMVMPVLADRIAEELGISRAWLGLYLFIQNLVAIIAAVGCGGFILRFGPLTLARGALCASLDGEAVDLTARQFQLLWALASRAGRVLDRAQLSAALGEDHGDPFDRTIDVHISRIRAAIETDPRRPKYLKTVRGVGYLFVDAAS